MSLLIKGYEMPKDCPQCPCSYWTSTFSFEGCRAVPGKRHAMDDESYARSIGRPEWCPLVEVSDSVEEEISRLKRKLKESNDINESLRDDLSWARDIISDRCNMGAW